MKRPLVVSLVATVAIAVVALAVTLGVGWAPKLGLDLAGGAEVTYQPVRHLTQSDMNITINVIRNRIDGAGVSGALVSSQGQNVVVQLPGLKNPQQVIDLIKQTAQLYFRPVLCLVPNYTPVPGSPNPGPLPSTCAPSTLQTAANLQPTVNAAGLVQTNSVPPDATLARYPTTSPLTETQHQTVLVRYPSRGMRALLGPAPLSGRIIKSAQDNVLQTGSWVVDATLTGSGSPRWDALAQQYFDAPIGIELEGVLQSAPITDAGQSSFTPFNGHIEISGQFTESSAKSLAQLLSYGSLPVSLTQVDKRQVSATLGSSSLVAGLAAGIGGLVLVLLYTIAYYRALGIVVVSGLLLTAALLWAIVSALGHSGMNLTLDLAGVTGLIVSIGITVDSYIVYFERLKDEARAGRSVRTSVGRSFSGAFRTVLAADMVSLAAAVVLYLVAVGTVRGFAFFLGLSTILDIATTYFFTRPLVTLLGRSRAVTEARFIGIARGLAMGSGDGS